MNFKNNMGFILLSVAACHVFALPEKESAESETQRLLYSAYSGCVKDNTEAGRCDQYKPFSFRSKGSPDITVVGAEGARLAYEQDKVLSEKILSQCTGVGDLNCNYQYGLALLTGRYDVVDTERAMMYLNFAAAENHKDAQYEIGYRLLTGKDVERNAELGNQYLIAAAKNCKLQAMEYVGAGMLMQKDDPGLQGVGLTYVKVAMLFDSPKAEDVFHQYEPLFSEASLNNINEQAQKIFEGERCNKEYRDLLDEKLSVQR